MYGLEVPKTDWEFAPIPLMALALTTNSANGFKRIAPNHPVPSSFAKILARNALACLVALAFQKLF